MKILQFCIIYLPKLMDILINISNLQFLPLIQYSHFVNFVSKPYNQKFIMHSN